MSSYLGQNFLTDEGAKQQIIQTVTQMQSDFDLDNVIEIGPGQGALTQGLVTLFDRLTLIEMDTKMKPYLEGLKAEGGRLKAGLGTTVNPGEGKIMNNSESLRRENYELGIIWGDILQQGPTLSSRTDKPHTLIYGSLPYYITSPIFRLVMIESGHDYGLFIIQKEVGDKIATTARKKSYLWWLLNNEFEVTVTQIIPPHSFTPPPKVYSCVVKLTRRSQNMLSPAQHDQMLIILDQINGFKRKTLGKIWKIIGRDDLPSDLAPKRLEELGWEDMKQILSSGT